jgi:hypothetical protein
MLDPRFIIVSVILNLVGSIGYARDTIQGKTKPNRVTWLLWALAPMIAFFASLSEGVGLPALMTFMVGFGPLLIFLASFVNKKAYWNITKLDILCGSLAVSALVLWIITGTGNIAITLSILADLFAGIPTLIKAWKFPDTESTNVYRNGALSAIITLLIIDTWTYAAYGFPIYILAICVVLYVFIKFKVGARLTVSKPKIGNT